MMLTATLNSTIFLQISAILIGNSNLHMAQFISRNEFRFLNALANPTGLAQKCKNLFDHET